jgi:hypothetical protein
MATVTRTPAAPTWVSILLSAELLSSHAARLAHAVRKLNEAGRPRVELRVQEDIDHVLLEADRYELMAPGVVEPAKPTKVRV